MLPVGRAVEKNNCHNSRHFMDSFTSGRTTNGAFRCARHNSNFRRRKSQRLPATLYESREARRAEVPQRERDLSIVAVEERPTECTECIRDDDQRACNPILQLAAGNYGDDFSSLPIEDSNFRAFTLATASMRAISSHDNRSSISQAIESREIYWPRC
jgi:hypothetical protein